MTKICSKCGEEKPLDAYQVNRQCRDGKRPECKACMKIYASGWRLQNLERSTARKREYYRRNKDKIQEQHRDYIARNKEAVAEQHRKYRKENKEKIRAWFARTPRAAINKSLKLAHRRRPNPDNITLDELMRVYDAQLGICAVSGLRMTWFSGKTTPTSISIDRIDPKVGYLKENVRLVCYQVNCFRNRWSDADMLAMAKSIIANHIRTGGGFNDEFDCSDQPGQEILAAR